MSLCDRRYVLMGLGAALALPGCDLQPALGTGGAISALQGQTRIREPGSTRDYLMTQRLEERIGRGPDGAPFELSYQLSVTTSGLGTDRDGSRQRVQVIGRARYTLKRAGDKGNLSSGEVHNFTGYSPTGNTVSTQAARADAEERLVIILADEIIERILLAAPDLPL